MENGFACKQQTNAKKIEKKHGEIAERVSSLCCSCVGFVQKKIIVYNNI